MLSHSAAATEADRQFDHWLSQRGYSHQRRQSIRFSLHATGTLDRAVEAGWLALHHEGPAYEAYIGTLPEVPINSAEWEGSDSWETGSALPDDLGVFLAGLNEDLFEPSADDERERFELVYGPRFSIAG
jgi:hypothetical protein